VAGGWQAAEVFSQLAGVQPPEYVVEPPLELPLEPVPLPLEPAPLPLEPVPLPLEPVPPPSVEPMSSVWAPQANEAMTVNAASDGVAANKRVFMGGPFRRIRLLPSWELDPPVVTESY
jgi:hypothetical protein